MKVRGIDIDIEIPRFLIILFKTSFLFYMGIVMVYISTKENDNIILTDIALMSIGALGGAFLSYGFIVFIGDVRDSQTFKDLHNKMSGNFKRAFRNDRPD